MFHDVVVHVPPVGQLEDQVELGGGRSGHLLNSILLTFHNHGLVVKGAFSTTTQSRFASAVLDGVQGPLRLEGHSKWCSWFSLVLKTRRKAG